MSTVIEQIRRSPVPLSCKIVQLWALRQIHRDTPYGNLADAVLRDLVANDDVITALDDITSMLRAHPHAHQLRGYVPKYDQVEALNYNTEHTKGKTDGTKTKKTTFRR